MLEPKIARIVPRRKHEQLSFIGKKKEIAITADKIRSLFHLRQSDAAKNLVEGRDCLGISLTALKGACRVLGVGKWPYSRTRYPSEAGGELQTDERSYFVVGDSSSLRDQEEEEEEEEERCQGFGDLFMEALRHVQAQ
eukprot:760993-Hanusia_phi.AAC.2